MTSPPPCQWPDGHVVRQMINDREIGGECHDAVLQDAICRVFGITPIEAACAIDDAHQQGFIKPGFWHKQNWSPTGYDVHPFDRARSRARPLASEFPTRKGE